MSRFSSSHRASGAGNNGSRSQRRGHQGIGWLITAVALALVTGFFWSLQFTQPAFADVIAQPDAFNVDGAAFPTQPITTPVTQILSVTEDLGSIAQESVGAARYQARLNANVSFAKDSAVLLPAATQRLKRVAEQLAAQPPGNLSIVGYTDDLGSAEHGLVLSRQRADAVKAALGGVLGKFTVTVEGKGEADPLVPNTSENNRAKNRRVEIQLVHQ